LWNHWWNYFDHLKNIFCNGLYKWPWTNSSECFSLQPSSFSKLFLCYYSKIKEKKIWEMDLSTPMFGSPSAISTSPWDCDNDYLCTQICYTIIYFIKNTHLTFVATLVWCQAFTSHSVDILEQSLYTCPSPYNCWPWTQPWSFFSLVIWLIYWRFILNPQT
jgi:hypothetical protein